MKIGQLLRRIFPNRRPKNEPDTSPADSSSHRQPEILLNPYNCTKPGNLFVGYERLRGEILNGFLNGHSYALLGGRRCGKTSFLIQIEKDLLEKGVAPFHPLPRCFSLQEHGSALTPGLLFEKIYNLTIQELSAPAWKSGEPDKAYQSFLENLDSATPDLNHTYGPDWLVILLIDEMDNAVSCLPDDQFFQNLRHFLMDSRFSRHFRLLATGVKGMADLIASGSPLNNLRNTYLRILTEQEARTLVTSGFTDVSDEELSPLFELTGRHPYLLQGILEKLWPDQTEWTRETVEQAGAEFLNQHKDFERWFDKFTPTERDFYRCLSAAWPGSVSLDHIAENMSIPKRKARETLTLLSYHGILDASDINALKIAGTFFRDWYLENHTAPCPPNDTQENNMKVFISYATEDFEMADRLYNDLKANNITPWLDRHDLLPGQKWKFAIREAIKNSDYYLILLSSQSISKRGFVQKEMRMALDILDEFPQPDIFIIPVRLDECEPVDERLQDLHAVDLFPSYENGLSKILRVLSTVQDDETGS